MKKFLLHLIFLHLIACSSSPIATIEIDTGDYGRIQTPFTFEVEKDLIPSQQYYLQEIESGHRLPVEIKKDGSLLVLLDSLPAGKRTRYELYQGSWKVDRQVKLIQQAEGIHLMIGGSPILFYQIETAFPEEGQPDYYKRSGFIHPLYSPRGQVLTDDFPKGHTHQHAIFNAWVNTLFKGEKVDFWNQHQETGTVEHVELLGLDEGALSSQIHVKLSHLSLEHGEVLEEDWKIRAYPMKDYFLFDLISEQTNTTKDTLFILEYHYGGMAFRGSKEWNDVDSDNYTNSWQILTSEGKTKEDADHSHAAWVDASGMVEEEIAGVTVFGFPDNFRYPQAIRVHPSMPYWVYSPMVDGEFYIAPGQKYHSRYRYYVHQGEPDTSIIEKIAADIENPIKVEVLD